jgi:hypothetical protein
LSISTIWAISAGGGSLRSPSRPPPGQLRKHLRSRPNRPRSGAAWAGPPQGVGHAPAEVRARGADNPPRFARESNCPPLTREARAVRCLSRAQGGVGVCVRQSPEPLTWARGGICGSGDAPQTWGPLTGVSGRPRLLVHSEGAGRSIPNEGSVRPQRVMPVRPVHVLSRADEYRFRLLPGLCGASRLGSLGEPSRRRRSLRGAGFAELCAGWLQSWRWWK